jgi:hypothetical protein
MYHPVSDHLKTRTLHRHCGFFVVLSHLIRHHEYQPIYGISVGIFRNPKMSCQERVRHGTDKPVYTGRELVKSSFQKMSRKPLLPGSSLQPDFCFGNRLNDIGQSVHRYCKDDSPWRFG